MSPGARTGKDMHLFQEVPKATAIPLAPEFELNKSQVRLPEMQK